MEIIALVGRDNANSFYCPRCQKWHLNRWNIDWPQENNKNPDRSKLCNRCAITMVIHFPDWEISIKIMENFTFRGIDTSTENLLANIKNKY